MRYWLPRMCLLLVILSGSPMAAQEPAPGLDHTLFRFPIPGGFAVTPDLVHLIVSQPESAELLYFDTVKEKLTRKVELEFQPGPMVLRDDSLFVAGVGSSVIHEVNWKTGKVVREMAIPGDGISHLAVHPKQPLVFASTNVLEVYVVDMAERKAYKTKASGDHLAVSPDGESLFTGMQPRSPDGVLLIRETPDGAIRFIFDNWGVRATLAKYKISGHSLSLTSSQPNASVNGYRMHLSPDGKRVMLPGGGGWRPPADGGTGGGYVIAIFDAGNLNAKLGQAPHGEAIVYHPLLNVAAISGSGHNLLLCDGKSFKERQNIKFSEGGHGGGHLLAFVGKGTKIALYNGANPKATNEGLHFFNIDLNKEERAQLTKAYGTLPKPVLIAATPRSKKPDGPAKRGAVNQSAKSEQTAKKPENARQPLFKSSVLELTDRAPTDWIFKEAKIGALLLQGRDYNLTALPKEIQGGTIVWRSSMEGWLNPGAVEALQPCTAYAIVRTREHGKEQFDDVMLTKFLREGWEEVSEPVATNVDAAFDSQWIALKKAVPEGLVTLQLDTISFDRRSAIFAFKATGAPVKASITGSKAAATDKPTSRTKALFRSDIVELTQKASPNWIFKEAKVGTNVWSDIPYFLTALPAEMIGGSYLLRDSGQQFQWLPADAITALDDCTVYAMIRWKYLGKEEVSDSTFAQLDKEGWAKVEGNANVNFPSGEDWQWTVVKKKVSKGPVVIPLQSVKWGRHSVLFALKK